MYVLSRVVNAIRTHPSVKPVASSLKSWLPWVISAGLLSWVYLSNDMADIAKGLATADYWSYGLLLTVFVLCSWLMDSFYLTVSYSWLAGKGSFIPILRARAASYLLAIVSNFVGMGGIVFFMKKRFGVKLTRGTGIMVLELLQEVGAFGILSLAALLFMMQLDDALVQTIFNFGIGTVLFYIACFLTSRVFRHYILNRDREKALAVVADLPATKFAALLGIKVVYNLMHGIFVGLAFHCFYLDVPLVFAAASTQVIQLVRSLPVFVFGIGVDQISFSYLFAPWEIVSGQVIAFSVIYTFSMVFSRGLLGLIFTPGIIKEFQKDK
jgi:hypothetical protein